MEIVAVAGSAHGAHNPVIGAELGAEATNVHVNGAWPRNLGFAAVCPEAGDNVLAGEGLTLAEDEELQQLKLAVGEVAEFAVEQDLL